jgi:hypothetical protein
LCNYVLVRGWQKYGFGVAFYEFCPVLIKKYLLLLGHGFGIKDEKLRAPIHLHEYHNPDAQLKFWSGVTGIPPDQFHEPYIKPHTGKTQRSGYPGCICISYGSAELGHLVKMVYSIFGQSP